MQIEEKISSLFLLFILAFNISTAQLTSIKGTVKNEKGAALPYVFVQDEKSKSAIYADSLGNFSIGVKAPSILRFSLNGYKDTSIEIVNDKKLEVVLKYNNSSKNITTGEIGSSKNNVAVADAFSGHANVVSSNNTAYNEGGQMQFNGGTFPILKEKEETHGSRYYDKDWSNGFVINDLGKKVSSAASLFNYDKVTGDLLLTYDKKTAMTVNRDQVKSFTLYDKNGAEHQFELVPQIDNVHFAEVLASGNKYQIYKLTKTKFIPSNYTTNGLVSSGNSYDEYKDENNYYLVNSANQVQKLKLKSKAIKEAFPNDKVKVDSFFKKNDYRDIDDTFLKDLGNYLNY